MKNNEQHLLLKINARPRKYSLTDFLTSIFAYSFLLTVFLYMDVMYAFWTPSLSMSDRIISEIIATITGVITFLFAKHIFWMVTVNRKRLIEMDEYDKFVFNVLRPLHVEITQEVLERGGTIKIPITCSDEYSEYLSLQDFNDNYIL